MKKNKHTGSSFDDCLKEEEILEEVEDLEIKKILIKDLLEAMEKKKISKSQMAKKMKTSRSALDNLLNSSNPSLNLTILFKAAGVLRKKLIVKVV